MSASQKIEKIELSNTNVFYRKNGLPCPSCGSKKEYLFIVGGKLYLICSGCEQPKGKDAFEKNR